MVNINIITIFPEQVKGFIDIGMLNQAVLKGTVEYNVVDIRDFSENRHRKVDDEPYGGGPGMVMSAPSVIRAVESLSQPGIKILLAPNGREFTQSNAEDISGKDITLICGRYTGIDYRVRKHVDLVFSVGNYIVSGGELPALIITEAAVRLIPGVLGDKKSLEEDRGYPVYTRPQNFRGMNVPEVLLSGNHKKIENFRKNNQEFYYEKNYDRNDK
ncbi:MAG: tRNA (guanosine(37)-N1)-methyltransferase TrmD [Elusimicrobia bacterium]|jgi:tRNA (guanine37-N1)-methyltransferase|nr:tRNA (guanosine(37)-N1)-methyltransferase TrmD [Elusimicrobiota bacterium]